MRSATPTVAASCRQPLALVFIGGVAADDEHLDGRGEVDEGGGADEDVEALERLQTADEEGEGTAAESQRAAGGGTVAGPEALQIDAAGHDADAVGVGAVELHEEALLMRGGADQAVGAGDDLALRVDPAGGLPLVAAGAVLDLAEGVEHGDVRTAPAVGEGHAGDGGDPVVGVDEVVRGGSGVGVGGHERFHAGAKLGLQVMHGQRGQGRGPAGGDVDDADVAIERDDAGQAGVVATGEDVDAATAAAEFAGQGGDVDVHAAGLGSAGDGEGGGVGAEEGESLQVVGHHFTSREAAWWLGAGRRSRSRVTVVA